MISRQHCHNKVLHLFAQEALWACALYALDRNAEKNRNLKKGENAKGQNRFYSVSSLLEHVIFLDKLMSFEFVRDRTVTPTDDELGEVHCRVLQKMIDRGVFSRESGHGASFSGPENDALRKRHGVQPAQTSSKSTVSQLKNDLVGLSPDGERMFGFLCSTVWPFVDGYFAAAMCLTALVPNTKMETKTLVERSQWLSETLFRDKRIEHYECCASNTLSNAIANFQSLGVLSKAKDGKVHTMHLSPQFQNQENLQVFVDKISFFRKFSPEQMSETSKVADFPMLAKHFARSSI